MLSGVMTMAAYRNFVFQVGQIENYMVKLLLVIDTLARDRHG